MSKRDHIFDIICVLSLKVLFEVGVMPFTNSLYYVFQMLL